MPEYQVFENDGEVMVSSGTTMVSFDTKRARRRAHTLALGAGLAVEQKRRLTPCLYGLPGVEPIEPTQAYWIAAQIFTVACDIDIIGGERFALAADTAAPEPDVIHVIGPGGEVARIVG